MTFKIIMMILSIVILVVYIVFVVKALKKAKLNIKFPPKLAECPDYFSLGNDGNESYSCYNVKKLGNYNSNDVSNSNPFNKCVAWGEANDKDGNPPDISKKYSLTTKCKFRQQCGVSWDGLNDSKCSKHLS